MTKQEKLEKRVADTNAVYAVAQLFYLGVILFLGLLMLLEAA